MLPFRSGGFDGITCGYALRNFTDLAATFDEMARVVRPGGRLSLLEVAEPRSGLFRAGFRLWFRKVVPSLVHWSRTGPPITTCPSRRPTCPRVRRSLGCSTAPVSPR